MGRDLYQGEEGVLASVMDLYYQIYNRERIRGKDSQGPAAPHIQ